MEITKEILEGKAPVAELELRYLAENHKDYDLTKLDTSWIHDMGGIFTEIADFNQNIGKWNTSNVIDMSFMFEKALAFNQDISSWDTSGVLYMDGMFWGAEAFNQDLSGWDVSNVLDYDFFARYTDSYKLPRPNFNEY